MERALVADYLQSMEAVISKLTLNNVTTHLPLALELAKIPESIKGFGHVKERNLAAARLKWDLLIKQV
jgi:indolepyruvate ferredoxin oxidoreductase